MPEVQSLIDGAGPAGVVPGVETPVLSSGGEAVSPLVRTFFERRFARDLGDVRLHRDGDADRRSRALRARAVTIGPDIFFRERAYDPDSDRGLALLAHELTHVVQQGGRRPSSGWPVASREGPPEHEARAVTNAIVAGRALPSIGTAATPAVSCVTDEELAAKSDWAALSPEERQRILSSGPGYEEIKKEVIAGLIEAMTTARQGFIASLREQVSANLSPGLQPAANTLIDGIELDLEVISAVLFFDLGVVIGFGEGLAGMIAGLFRIAWALLEFVVDYFVAIVLHDLEPLAEDLDALAPAWHDLLSIDMMGILEGWLIRFEAAPIEGRAEMVGEFVGEVLAFIATWETSTSRLSKFLPPPGAAPQLAAAVAGGGSMAVPLTEKAVKAIDILGPPIVGLGPPASLQIMNMSGKGDEPESKAGAATPPAAGPTRKATELAPGPIDPVLLPLLEGVGLVARPPSAALLRAREALKLGTATTADYEVLLQEAVNDARDFIRTSSLLSRQPRIEPAASWKVMQGSCGRGRDASAASLAGMAAESVQALRIDRFQAVRVFGKESYPHAFSVVTFSDDTKYLVDPTFSQFQFAFANAPDVTFATELSRNGFARLDDVTSAQYASHLRRAELGPASASESSALGARIHTSEWADKVEPVGAGRPGIMLHEEPPGSPGSQLDVRSRDEMLDDAEEIWEKLVEQGDPYDLAKSLEWLIHRLDEPGESLP